MLYATHRFVKHWTKSIRSVTQRKSCTRCPNQPDGNLLCPSLFSALRLLAQRSYTNQTNSFPNPTYPSGTSPHLRLQQKQQRPALSYAWQTISKARPGIRKVAAAACCNSQSLPATDICIKPPEYTQTHIHNHIPEPRPAAKITKAMCFSSAPA
jgi:hypothetical protein